MSEEAKTEQSHDELDYKAMYEEALANSRKWEKRSKENAAKAKKLDELEASSKTVEERLAALESENARLTAEREHRILVDKVAQESGVAREIVESLNATDEETLLGQAQAIANTYKTPAGAPSMPEAGKFPREGTAPKTTAQQFADFFNASLGN